LTVYHKLENIYIWRCGRCLLLLFI